MTKLTRGVPYIPRGTLRSPKATATAIDALNRRKNALEGQIKKLRQVVINAGLWREAPCCICGYNGPGYYQPETHKCAALAAKSARVYSEDELKKWWPAKCPDCGWYGLSRDAAGGEAMADTGDHNDVVCPKCETPVEEDKRVIAEMKPPMDWGRFVSWLIDHHEGDIISEEMLQLALHNMLQKQTSME